MPVQHCLTASHRHKLFVPPLIACIADVTMTFAGQTTHYWAGDSAALNEANPAAHLLLSMHPAVFIAAAVGSCLVVWLAIQRLNRHLAVGIALVVTLGHALAAAAWLSRSGLTGIAAAAGLLVVIERLFRWAMPHDPSSTSPHSTNSPTSRIAAG